MPGPALSGARILSGKRIRHRDSGNSAGAIFRPERTRLPELASQPSSEQLGQHHDAILPTFALAHDEDLSIEVHVLYAKAQTLHQSKTRAVKQCGHGRERGLYLLEQARNFRP